jgi:hypothetical protein
LRTTTDSVTCTSATTDNATSTNTIRVVLRTAPYSATGSNSLQCVVLLRRVVLNNTRTWK